LIKRTGPAAGVEEGGKGSGVRKRRCSSDYEERATRDCVLRVDWLCPSVQD